MSWPRDNWWVIVPGEGYFCFRSVQVFGDGWVCGCCQKNLSGDLLLLPVGGPSFLYHVDPSMGFQVLIFIWRPLTFLDGGHLSCWQWGACGALWATGPIA